jgi:hypothetical protein
MYPIDAFEGMAIAQIRISAIVSMLSKLQVEMRGDRIFKHVKLFLNPRDAILRRAIHRGRRILSLRIDSGVCQLNNILRFLGCEFPHPF